MNFEAEIQKVKGKKILGIKLHEDRDPQELVLTFADGSRLTLWDNGKTCCEHRYMTTDDDLKDYVGGKLREVIVQNGGTLNDWGTEEHEVEFLKIRTSRGWFTVANHNEHNGYYGGFDLSAKVELHVGLEDLLVETDGNLDV
jgi:hypothetical protein